MTHKFFLGILIISSFVLNILAADSCSDGWKQYEQKCVKVIGIERTMNNEEAKNACNGSLLSIHSKKEQDFISNFLFNETKVLEGVWIGLKKSGNSFKWNDDSPLDFENWLTEHPPNKVDRDCVEISPESNPIGKWYDSPCAKKNYAICQVPIVNVDTLLKMILESNKKLEETRKAYNYLNDLTSDNYIKFELFKNKEKKQKAFFIPSSDYKTPKTWDDAVALCKRIKNASLVDMDSPVKEFLFLSYLGQLGSQSEQLDFIWLNGHKDSGKWKWISNNIEIANPNWDGAGPSNEAGTDYLGMFTTQSKFGKKTNKAKTDTGHVICEMYVNF